MSFDNARFRVEGVRVALLLALLAFLPDPARGSASFEVVGNGIGTDGYWLRLVIDGTELNIDRRSGHSSTTPESFVSEWADDWNTFPFPPPAPPPGLFVNHGNGKFTLIGTTISVEIGLDQLGLVQVVGEPLGVQFNPILFWLPPGSEEEDPVLPDTVHIPQDPNESAVFTFTQAECEKWVDPPVVDGFEYRAAGGGPEFKGIIEFPSEFAPMSVIVNGGVVGDRTFDSSDSLDFPTAGLNNVRDFAIVGIWADLGVNGAEAFPLRIDCAGQIDFVMTSVTAQNNLTSELEAACQASAATGSGTLELIKLTSDGTLALHYRIVFSGLQGIETGASFVFLNEAPLPIVGGNGPEKIGTVILTQAQVDDMLNGDMSINIDSTSCTPEILGEVVVVEKPVPALSPWGVLASGLLLIAAMLWTLRGSPSTPGSKS